MWSLRRCAVPTAHTIATHYKSTKPKPHKLPFFSQIVGMISFQKKRIESVCSRDEFGNIDFSTDTRYEVVEEQSPL